MILTIKTDQPVAEISLLDKDKLIDDYSWKAHRKLATTLLSKIDELLESNGLVFADCKGIVVYKGPGSFTGLRIGITTANTLAYSLNVPIVGAEKENWIQTGLKELKAGKNSLIVTPHYGGEANITRPKK